MLLRALTTLAAVLTVAGQPDVRPPSLHFKSPGSGALTCVFPSPLTDCRLRVSEHNGDIFDAVVAFPLGPHSPSVTLRDGYLVSYHGEGLPRGHCGVALRLTGGYGLVALIECFGRYSNGTWSRGHGTLTAQPDDVMPVSALPPSSILTAAGGDVAVLLKARDARALASCGIKTPAAGRVNLGSGNSIPAGSRYRAHGAGQARGECGFTLGGVTQQDAGVWWWFAVRFSPQSWAYQATVLLVQAAPEGLPELRVQGALTVGSLLQASCTAPPATPPARLRWFLAGKLLRDDANNETALEDVAKSRPWVKMAVVQKLSRTLLAGDSTLECRMTHVALSGDKSASQRLIPTPIALRAERAVVRSAVGFRSELACVAVADTEVAVAWSRASGTPVEQSDLVATGKDKQRHWLRLQDTAVEDFGNITCTATGNGALSVSKVILLTGLPGTPQWAGNASHLAWRVESAVPLSATVLRIRRGRGRLQEFNDLDVSVVDEDWQLVTANSLPLSAGKYSAQLQVANEYGSAQRSQFQDVTLASVAGRTQPAAAEETGCFPVPTATARARCTPQGNCDRLPVPLGTSAELRCRDGFKPQRNHNGSMTTRCTERGWQPKPATCRLDCGVKGPTRTLIAGGEDAAHREFPWHVGIFRSTGNNQFTQDCGGTIVSRTIIVTAAHCFYDEALREFKPHSLYQVTAGKHHRDWSRQELDSQTRAVAEIHTPARYRGRPSNFQYDIAVVRLSRGFDWTSSVAPVCVDWTERCGAAAQLSPGDLGTVAGWGLTLNDTQSDVLQKTNLPFVDFDTCFSALSDGTKKLLTEDKFCAGVANQSRSVCPGDSGGGLVFATGDRYYLKGVVSISFRPSSFVGKCYSQLYTAFTSVSSYLEWIRPYVDA